MNLLILLKLKMEEILYKHTAEVHNSIAAEIVLPLVFNLVDVASVVDVGCGTGTWMLTAKRLGINDFIGIDGVYMNEENLVIEKDKFLKVDIGKKFQINRRFDLAISLEVAEHLPFESSDTFINNIVNLSDNILFSAATLGQGGQNHLNEQPINFWIKKFENKGYTFHDIIRPQIWENNDIEFWYKQNIIFFSKNKISYDIESIPKIINVIHPELYKYRIEQIMFIKNTLNLESDLFDNYKLKINKLLSRIFKLVHYIKSSN